MKLGPWLPLREHERYRPREPFMQNTVVEINVPSGRLIVADDLRSVDYFRVDPPASINSSAGKDDWSQLYASSRDLAYGHALDFSPHIVARADGSLLVVSLESDEDTDEPIPVAGENIVAEICTDHWAVMMVDYQSWLDHGGHVVTAGEPHSRETVIDVQPGRYRWTVYTHNDATFDDDACGRVELALLEPIGDTREPS